MGDKGRAEYYERLDEIKAMSPVEYEKMKAETFRDLEKTILSSNIHQSIYNDYHAIYEIEDGYPHIRELIDEVRKKGKFDKYHKTKAQYYD